MTNVFHVPMLIDEYLNSDILNQVIFVMWHIGGKVCRPLSIQDIRSRESFR